MLRCPNLHFAKGAAFLQPAPPKAFALGTGNVPGLCRKKQGRVPPPRAAGQRPRTPALWHKTAPGARRQKAGGGRHGRQNRQGARCQNRPARPCLYMARGTFPPVRPAAPFYIKKPSRRNALEFRPALYVPPVKTRRAAVPFRGIWRKQGRLLHGACTLCRGAAL